MKIRVLIVSTLVAGMVGTAAPANAYYPDLALAGLLQSPFGALILGAAAHYSSQPPQRAPSPTKDCATGAPMRAQYYRDGSWDTIAKGRTNDRGEIKFKVKDRPGKYRVAVKAYTTPGGVSCFAGVSNVRTRN